MNETTMKQREPEKTAERQTYAPPVDIYESKEEILIVADLPGVRTEDLEVNLDKEHLTILAHRPPPGAGSQAFDYTRTFVVPRGIDADKISANLQNGVLRLQLPKPAALKPRQIAVRAG